MCGFLTSLLAWPVSLKMKDLTKPPRPPSRIRICSSQLTSPANDIDIDNLLWTCVHYRALWYQLSAEVHRSVRNSLLFPVYRTPRWCHIISSGASDRAIEADHVLQSTHSDLLPREAEPPFSNYLTPINQLLTIYGYNSYQSLLSILLKLPLFGSFDCLLWSEC
jgi:hypothetical protein